MMDQVARNENERHENAKWVVINNNINNNNNSNTSKICKNCISGIFVLHFYVVHFRVLHFHPWRLQLSVIVMPCYLVRHFRVLHFHAARLRWSVIFTCCIFRCPCVPLSVSAPSMHLSVSAPSMHLSVSPFPHLYIFWMKWSQLINIRSTWHWRHQEGQWLKGQGQPAMDIEILLTQQLLNNWRDFNQNIRKYFRESGHELNRFSR